MHPSRDKLLNINLCRSGRWRSEYTVDLDARKITGQILVNVHYYEQGNVPSTDILRP